MLQPRQMLVLVAFVWLMGAVSARRNITQFCADLSRSMAANQEVYTNSQVAMKEALNKLKAWSNIGMGSRLKLAKAWKVVIDDEPCNVKSAHHVSIIALCKPERYREMGSLAYAVRKYTDKCLTPSFWDEQLERALEGHLGVKDKSGLTNFINEKFIDQYRIDNPGEREINFDNDQGSEKCCKPKLSKNSVLEATQCVLGTKTLDSALRFLRADPETLESVLEAYLFNPCHRYLYLTHELIMRAKDVSKYHKNGSEAFILQLSKEFRNGIFRYRYCLPLLYRGTPCSYHEKREIYKFFSRRVDEQCTPQTKSQ